jgi:hypothetical protein
MVFNESDRNCIYSIWTDRRKYDFHECFLTYSPLKMLDARPGFIIKFLKRSLIVNSNIRTRFSVTKGQTTSRKTDQRRVQD